MSGLLFLWFASCRMRTHTYDFSSFRGLLVVYMIVDINDADR